MRSSPLVILLCLVAVENKVLLPLTFTYNKLSLKKNIGECATITGDSYYTEPTSKREVTWRKNMKILKPTQRKKVAGTSLTITSLRPSDFAVYSVTIEGRNKNIDEQKVSETTNFWINVKGCEVNEKETPSSNTSCERRCTRACHDGWHYVPGTVKKCVRYIGDLKSWTQASENCQEMGAVLTTIASASENRFLRTILPSADGAWIGLNDRRDEAHYEWNFEYSAKALDFFSWGPGEPNNYNKGCNIENCVTMKKGGGRWNDLICSAFSSYICEVDKSYEGSSSWSCLGDNCFKYFHDQLPWHEALRLCKSIHPSGHLATISTHSQNTFVAQVIEGPDDEIAWIGLNDIWEAGLYSWNEYKGSPNKSNYFNWAEEEPNDKFITMLNRFNQECPGEDCIQLKGTFGNATWQDLSCDTKLPYICELIREQRFTTGGIVGMIIGLITLFGMIIGFAHVSYMSHKRNTVQDIIKEAYTDDLATRDNNVFLGGKK